MSDLQASLASELSANLAWLTGLARSLVGESAADDLVQETVENTLKHPPSMDRPLRPWLKTVMRNASATRWRASLRRDRRQAMVEQQADAEEADDTIARLEISRRLVTAVLALDEPYRTAITRRYVDGLSAADIAREQGVPAATVRSRVMRGLELLRADLDRQSDGDRDSWRFAMAPLLLPTKASGGATATGAFATKFVVLALAVAAVAVIVHTFNESPVDPAPVPTSVATPSTAKLEHAPRKPSTLASGTSRPRRFAGESTRKRFASKLAEARQRNGAPRKKKSYDYSGAVVPAGAAFPAATPQRGTLDKNYIVHRIAEIKPLLRECYELALAEDDSLSGQLTVTFTVDAEEEVGGYVSVADIAEDSTLRDPQLNECVVETMLSLEFIAPEGGGTVDVRYPFLFETE